MTVKINDIELEYNELRVDKEALESVISKYEVDAPEKVCLTYIKQADAARLLRVSRQRIGEFLSHPEHSKSIKRQDKLVNLEDILNFKGRNQFSGKPFGKQSEV